MNRRPSIHISIEGDVIMHVNELWPDRPPRKITAEAVKALMESHGTKAEVLRDWFLLSEVRVEVYLVSDGGLNVGPPAQVWADTEEDLRWKAFWTGLGPGVDGRG